MALVKVDSSSRRKPKKESDSMTSNGTDTASHGFNNLNAFSQFYCKRITVQNSNDGEPPVTRIEEAMFSSQPDAHPYLFQSNGVKVRPHKKSSHSSKNGSQWKSSPKKHSKHDKKIKAPFLKIASAIMLACLLFGTWFSTHYWCQAKPMNFLGLEHSLKTSVIGQDDTLNILLLNFYKSSNLNSQLPVFLFSGSTGVGKSFVADLIVEGFPGKGHKETFMYPTPAPEAVVTRLVSCEHNLLIVDSLYFKDAEEVASWTKRVQKESAAYSKPLWIIVVFTTEHWTSDSTATPTADVMQEISKISNRIVEFFTSQEIDTKIITFKPMDIQSVKECARKELESFNLLADESQLDQIVHQLTKTPTLRQKGCKHVKKYFLYSNDISGLQKASD